VGKARSHQYSGAPERCKTKEGSNLTLNLKTRLESLARDKNSSLFLLLKKLYHWAQAEPAT
jgi:hypothetical protein